MSDKAPSIVVRLRQIIASVSTAAWIALGTFGGLVLLTLFAWFLAWRNPLWVPWGAFLTFSRGVWLLVLAIIACFAEYLLFRMWFDETPLPNRDLRLGWTAGLRMLRQEAVDVRSRPCFLILDPLSACERWFDAAGVRAQSPETALDSPVRWQLSDEAVYVVLRGTGCLAAWARELEELRRRPLRFASAQRMLPSGADPVCRTSVVPECEGTCSREDHSDAFVSIDAEAVRDELNRHGAPPVARTGDRRPIVTVSLEEQEVSDVRVSSIEVARQSRRLSEVCRRVASCRRPVVPVNGICVLLPEGLLSSLTGAGPRLGQALRHDLLLLHHELQAQAPVSVLLTGADEDPGIVELIRRSGQDAAAAGAWGLLGTPGQLTADTVARYGESLTKSLQSRVAHKLRDPREVGRPGAEQLFRLLSSLRNERGREIRAFVTSAFSCGVREQSAVMAGIALAATGERPTERAFAKAAHRQLLGNQEFVEWSGRGRRQERRLWGLASVCGGLSVLAGLVLVALLVSGR